MTKEEAIKIIDCYDIGFYDLSGAKIPADKLAGAFDMAIEALTNVQNMHKGKWIKKQVFNPELDKYVPLIECSVCGYEPYFGGSESKFNYCANCGAIMEK